MDILCVMNKYVISMINIWQDLKVSPNKDKKTLFYNFHRIIFTEDF